MTQTKYKRKIRLVRPKFQKKVIATFVSLACMFVLVQAIVVNFALIRMAKNMPEGGDVILSQLPGVLGLSLAISAGFLLPVMVGIGWVLTHRIAGPVYRFETYLNGIAEGGPVSECHIRERDEFGSLCEAINRATHALAERSGAEPARRAG